MAPARLGISIDVARDLLNELVGVDCQHDNPEDMSSQESSCSLHMPAGQRRVDPTFSRIWHRYRAAGNGRTAKNLSSYTLVGGYGHRIVSTLSRDPHLSGGNRIRFLWVVLDFCRFHGQVRVIYRWPFNHNEFLLSTFSSLVVLPIRIHPVTIILSR